MKAVYLNQVKEQVNQTTRGQKVNGMSLLTTKYSRLLENAEELGKVPVSTIDDGDLEELKKELKEKGYVAYLDASTDNLIIEEV